MQQYIGIKKIQFNKAMSKMGFLYQSANPLRCMMKLLKLK